MPNNAGDIGTTLQSPVLSTSSEAERKSFSSEQHLPANLDAEKTECPIARDEFEVGWDGEDDPQNPKNWSKKRKVFTVATISFITFLTYDLLELSYRYLC